MRPEIALAERARTGRASPLRRAAAPHIVLPVGTGLARGVRTVITELASGSVVIEGRGVGAVCAAPSEVKVTVLQILVILARSIRAGRDGAIPRRVARPRVVPIITRILSSDSQAKQIEQHKETEVTQHPHKTQHEIHSGISGRRQRGVSLVDLNTPCTGQCLLHNPHQASSAGPQSSQRNRAEASMYLVSPWKHSCLERPSRPEPPKAQSPPPGTNVG